MSADTTYQPKIRHENGGDKLAIASGGEIDIESGGDFKIAGTKVTATAANLNAIPTATGTGTEIDNASKQSIQAADGIHPLQVAVATFDPTGVAGMRTIAAHGLGVTLPANAIVVGGVVDVNTVLHSAGGDAGTVAISVESADDIIAAAAVSGAPYSSIGQKAIKPKANTPEAAVDIKTTVAREITATVVGQALTGGKLTVYLYFIAGKASA